MLCIACKNFFQNNKWIVFRDLPFAVHHASGENLAAAVEAGCPICTVAANNPRIKQELSSIYGKETPNFITVEDLAGVRETPFTFIAKRFVGKKYFLFEVATASMVNEHISENKCHSLPSFELLPAECKFTTLVFA